MTSLLAYAAHATRAAAAASLMVVSLAVPAAAAAESSGAGQQPAAGRADAGLAPGVDNWWFDKLKLDKVQRRTIGEGVQVAVVDGGLWTDAPDLAGIDLTVHEVAGRDPSTDSLRGGAHGAEVVALLAGQGTRSDGRPGLRGVAPGAEVHYYGTIALKNAGLYDLIARQIVTAVDDGADIITSSLKWAGDPDSIREALAYADEAGVVVVKSAGNGSQDRDMNSANGENGIVLVTSVDRDAVPQGNTRPYLNPVNPIWNAVSAPGWEATASGLVNGEWVTGAELNGTSVAAPIVAGQLALLKSLHPEATGNQLVQSLIHDTTNTEWEWLRGYGFGIASAFEMIQRDPTGWPDVNPLDGTMPRQVLRRYPPSIYGAAPDQEGSTDGASAAPESESTPAPENATSDSTTRPSADRPAEAVPSSQVATDSSDGSGVPGWAWALALAALAAAVATVMVRRRSGSTAATGKD